MSKPNFQTMRESMVTGQLRTNNVNDPRVLEALFRTAREDFVPEGLAAMAYADKAVPLGGGRALNPPLATARLLADADLEPSDAVLIVGAATGYAAALASGLAGEVTALEADAGLLGHARAALAGRANLRIVEGPLEAGAPKQGPFDAIIVDGAIELLPEGLVKQLKEGGRFLTGLADSGVTRLARGIKAGGRVALQPFADVECVPLPGFAKPRAFVF